MTVQGPDLAEGHGARRALEPLRLGVGELVGEAVLHNAECLRTESACKGLLASVKALVVLQVLLRFHLLVAELALESPGRATVKELYVQSETTLRLESGSTFRAHLVPGGHMDGAVNT